MTETPDIEEFVADAAPAGGVVLPEAIPGWKYIALHPGTKKPIHDAWHTVATDNREQLAAWAKEFEGCNWAAAMGPSNLSAFDIDGGQIGENSLAEFEIEEGCLPATREHLSARGGRHLIFADPQRKMRNSASKLGPKLDTRGQNGFIVVPPSVFEGGSYSVLADRPVADLPVFVVAALGHVREHAQAATDAVLDTDIALVRARRLLSDYIVSGHIATEGQGGDDRTYAVCAEVLNLGISIDKAIELLEPWNAACVPPWDAEGLLDKINHAAEYAQNDQGAWAVPPVRERINSEALDKLIADSGAPAPEAPQEQIEDAEEARLTEKFRIIRSRDFHKLKPPVYVVQNHIAEKSIGLLYGPWGSYKTFLLIEILGGIAGNVKVFGKYAINQVGPTLLAASEQPNAAAHNRFPAWCKKHGLSVPDVPFHLTRNVPLVQNPQEVIAFVKSVKREKLQLVAMGIDTLTRAMGGLDLNAPQAAGMMTNAADYIRDELGCAVIMTGHMGKDKSKKSFGSNLIPANCDFVFEIDRPLAKGPAIIFKNEKLKDDDTNPDLFLCSEKVGDSIVLNSITEGEYKRLIATGGPGETQALTAEIVASLRASGHVGAKMCSTKELLNLILAERGELENDPRIDDKARERLRNKIRALQEKGDDTILALGRKAPGQTAGRQWSAPALTADDDDAGYFGSLDDE